MLNLILRNEQETDIHAIYSKFGFKVIPNLTLAHVPTEYFQALSFSKTFPQGEVQYHPAFEATQ